MKSNLNKYVKKSIDWNKNSTSKKNCMTFSSRAEVIHSPKTCWISWATILCLPVSKPVGSNLWLPVSLNGSWNIRGYKCSVS